MGNKVVARFRDGRVVKGLVFHFDPEKKYCAVKNPETPYEEGTRVPFEDLKAVFFVKDLVGNKDYRSQVNEDSLAEEKKMGKKVCIEFKDGEKLYALVYDLEKFEKGFFAFPIDPDDNNDRIFVLFPAVEDIRVLAKDEEPDF